MNLLQPQWPAPACVRALSTLRSGGISSAPWDTLNLGDHVGDLPADVATNRQRFQQQMADVTPRWLRQVHGTRVVNAGIHADGSEADAAFSQEAQIACVVMTADCLPVLFCNQQGSWVAAAHAGWRGLAEGVLEATIASAPDQPSSLLAWLGPAIGPQAFEVGDEVRARFLNQLPEAEAAFVPQKGLRGKWLADLYQLARLRLQRAGVTAIYGGGFCTYTDSERFFSYRRDGQTGRMASAIWLSKEVA